MPTAAPAGAEARSPEPHQLSFRLFALVGAWRSAPPERALWRELLNLAIGDVRQFVVGTKEIAASTVWSVGLTVYMRADPAGIVGGFSVPTLAADCRHDPRTVKAALSLLKQWHVLKMERPSRRAPARWRMNLGGLDWAAVRARAQSAASNPSGGDTPPLSGGDTPPPKGYTEELPVQNPPVEPAATEVGRTGTARETDRPTCQAAGPEADAITSKQIARIACLARDLGEPYDDDEHVYQAHPTKREASAEIERLLRQQFKLGLHEDHMPPTVALTVNHDGEEWI